MLGIRIIIFLSIFVILNACESDVRNRDDIDVCDSAMQYYSEFGQGDRLLFINHNLSSNQSKIYARSTYDLVLVNELYFDIDSCWRPLLDKLYFKRFGISYKSFEIKLKGEVDSVAESIPNYMNHDGTFNFATDRPRILDSLRSDYFHLMIAGIKRDTILVPVELKIDTLGKIVDFVSLINTTSDIDSLIRAEIVKDYPVFTIPQFQGNPIILRYWPVEILVTTIKKG